MSVTMTDPRVRLRKPILRHGAAARFAAASLAATCLLPFLLPLGGCAGGSLALGDPIDRPGTWSPAGVNDANLRAMVADPHDLVAGKAAPDALAAEGAPPVGLLLSGKRQALPNAGSMSPGASGGASQGGGNATAQ